MNKNTETALSTLPAGTALIITGPQGSGKTQLAEKLASKEGPYRLISGMVLNIATVIKDTLQDPEVKTLIIDERPKNDYREAMLKQLITHSGEAPLRLNGSPVPVKVPKFIFLTQDPQPLKHLDDRRFHVIDLSTVETTGVKA